jgi:hypothetical protein
MGITQETLTKPVPGQAAERLNGQGRGAQAFHPPAWTAPHPLQPIVRPRSGLAMLEEFAYGKADVTGDAAQENGRDVTPSMKRNGGCPSVRMPKLLVGTLLAHLFETKLLQNRGNLSWLQNRNVSHGQAAMVTV